MAGIIAVTTLFMVINGAAATEANGIHYDWFPDPSDATQVATAKLHMKNVIKLTNDLGM